MKIWTILNCAKKLFLCKDYLFHSSKEVFLHNFRQFLENWIFEQKWWKFVLSQFVLRKYFLAKLFVPLIKGSVSPQFYAIFGKLNFWRNIDRREPYKNGEYLKYLKLCKEIIFVKIICSTHQRKCSTTILGNFWKIEFLKEYPQARALQKWWKFVLSQFVLRKYFLAKLFVPLNKRSDFPQFQAIFGKLNFEEMSTGADLTKMVKIWTILNCAKKFFFGKIVCSTHQRKSFPTI